MRSGYRFEDLSVGGKESCLALFREVHSILVAERATQSFYSKSIIDRLLSGPNGQRWRAAGYRGGPICPVWFARMLRHLGIYSHHLHRRKGYMPRDFYAAYDRVMVMAKPQPKYVSIIELGN